MDNDGLTWRTLERGGALSVECGEWSMVCGLCGGLKMESVWQSGLGSDEVRVGWSEGNCETTENVVDEPP